MFESTNKTLLKLSSSSNTSRKIQRYIILAFPSDKMDNFPQVKTALAEENLKAENIESLMKLSNTLAKEVKQQKFGVRGLDVMYLTFRNCSIGICNSLSDLLYFCRLKMPCNYLLFVSPFTAEEIHYLIKNQNFHQSFSEIIDYPSLLEAVNSQSENDEEAYYAGLFPAPELYTHYTNPLFTPEINLTPASELIGADEVTLGENIASANSFSPVKPICS